MSDQMYCCRKCGEIHNENTVERVNVGGEPYCRPCVEGDPELEEDDE